MPNLKVKPKVENPHLAKDEHWLKVINTPHLALNPKPKFGQPVLVIVLHAGAI